MNLIHSKYRVEFGTVSGLKGSYLGDTKEELASSIMSDFRVPLWIRESLIDGYFSEFKVEDYKSKEYVIDNAVHFMWTVKE
ncbi:hypothetical protein LC76P1_00121 [Lysinibacillus phage LC76P1]|nr:hypothetical protein LC76P1_00121 [Lysinibacillus phage LC76P1]